MQTYYSIKYALSSGKVESFIAGVPSEHGYVHRGGFFSSQKLGTDCFETEGEALAEFDLKRLKKIASLERQIAKLRAMTPRAA